MLFPEWSFWLINTILMNVIMLNVDLLKAIQFNDILTNVIFMKDTLVNVSQAIATRLNTTRFNVNLPSVLLMKASHKRPSGECRSTACHRAMS